jgi:serine protease inhibitor
MDSKVSPNENIGFQTKLLQLLAQKDYTKNVVISPLSIYIALAITATEQQEILNYPSFIHLKTPQLTILKK